MHPGFGKVKHSGGDNGNSGCSAAVHTEPWALQAGQREKGDPWEQWTGKNLKILGVAEGAPSLVSDQ